jgi:leucyl/phenylalanyl-tRNA--protein transferase
MVWDCGAVKVVMEPKLPGCESEFNEIEPEFLLKAYQLGVFPMAMHDGEIAWFSPDPRGIIPLDTFHIPHGLKRVLKKNPFEVRINHAFLETMAGCADRPSTWIDRAIVRSYHRLFEMGYAHSVETWQDGQLVGGLYGVALGGAFFGESMFSRVADASKVALVHLVERMRNRGFTLLDTQWSTPHLKQFGCEDISRSRYMRLLDRALSVHPTFVD